MSPITVAGQGLELYWVNVSEAGPVSTDKHDHRDYQVFRVAAGQSRIVSRSSSSEKTSLVNDLSKEIFFPFAKVVSREHAIIEWLEGRPVVKDLGSTHGTFVSRRQAVIRPSGEIDVQAPLAPLDPVIGILPLHDGDLIQFGKTCSRTGVQHEPVRCYVRFVEPAPLSPAKTSLKSQGFSVSDDLLDSECDLMSIDAETFHASSQRRSPFAQGMVVDLSGDDDDEIFESTPSRLFGVKSPGPPNTIMSPNFVSQVNDGQALQTMQIYSLSDSEAESFDSEGETNESDGEDCSESDISDSESERSLDLFELVPWHEEVHEAAHERIELDIEAKEARTQGPQYMLSYKSGHEENVEAVTMVAPLHNTVESAHTLASKTVHTPEVLEDDAAPATCPAVATTSVEESATSLQTMPAEDANEGGTSATSDVLATATTLADESGVPPGTSEYDELPPMRVVQHLSSNVTSSDFNTVGADLQMEKSISPTCSARKRKLEEADCDSRSAADASDTGSVSDEVPSSGDSFSASGSSTPCTSASSSPAAAKKRRLAPLEESLLNELLRRRQASSRRKAVRAFVGKAIYTTSLLTVGFFTGSLFTFKSMMNAAAAANASGPGPQ